MWTAWNSFLAAFDSHRLTEGPLSCRLQLSCSVAGPVTATIAPTAADTPCVAHGSGPDTQRLIDDSQTCHLDRVWATGCLFAAAAMPHRVLMLSMNACPDARLCGLGGLPTPKADMVAWLAPLQQSWLAQPQQYAQRF